MTVRFLADEDLDADIIEGLRLREPSIDIVDVKIAGLRGTQDSALLELAARQDRIVVSHDRRTMTRPFRDRLVAGKAAAGLLCGLHRRRKSGATRSRICLSAEVLSPTQDGRRHVLPQDGSR